jgi:RNA polymerase-interacting CarD/CdnL/TRCF family regulator
MNNFISRENLIKIKGGAKFSDGDTITTTSGDVGTITGQVDCSFIDNSTAGTICYVVKFKSSSLNGIYNQYDASHYYIRENQIKDLQTKTFTNCKYYLGQTVSVTNQLIEISNPSNPFGYEKDLVSDSGYISDIKKINGNCYYDIVFNRKKIGVKVPESYINTSTIYINPVINNPAIQDVGKNKTLRKDVVEYYQNKIQKWIKKYSEFKKYKNKQNKIISKSGFKFIYKTLKRFLQKNTKLNWYDLRDKNVYEDIKEFFETKLKNL